MQKLLLLIVGSALFSCVIGHPLPFLVVVVLCWILITYCGWML